MTAKEKVLLELLNRESKAVNAVCLKIKSMRYLEFPDSFAEGRLIADIAELSELTRAAVHAKSRYDMAREGAMSDGELKECTSSPFINGDRVRTMLSDVSYGTIHGRIVTVSDLQWDGRNGTFHPMESPSKTHRVPCCDFELCCEQNNPPFKNGDRVRAVIPNLKHGVSLGDIFTVENIRKSVLNGSWLFHPMEWNNPAAMTVAGDFELCEPEVEKRATKKLSKGDIRHIMYERFDECFRRLSALEKLHENDGK